MTAETLWALFWATGLPEVFNLYRLVRGGEENAEKTA